MNFPFNLPFGDKPELNRDEIIKLLKISPEAYAAFEARYADTFKDIRDDGSYFSVSAKQIIDSRKDTSIAPDELIDRIVEELVSQTTIYGCRKGVITSVYPVRFPDQLVSKEEVLRLSPDVRPQLTGFMAMRDMSEDVGPMLLWFYDKYLHESDPKKKAEYYHLFRQGLDIEDVDPLAYAMIGTNPNSMVHWYPLLLAAAKEQDFFKIPDTTIVRLPITLLQMTRLDYLDLTPTTLKIIDRWAERVFDLDPNGDYFIKTGTHCSKFDFRNARVTGGEIKELGEYLLYVHWQALQMAGYNLDPKTKRPKSVYGVSTTNEWIVREYIKDVENNPQIYKGMPLHTEYRVFIDPIGHPTDPVLSIVPYWEPETMKRRFSQCSDADTPDMKHDFVVYNTHEDVLMKRYYENEQRVADAVRVLCRRLNHPGQWSLDIMQNGDDFWLIDMALAENSAFYSSVPEELRAPSKEDWLPRIGGKDGFA